jgi:hypothetical protein
MIKQLKEITKTKGLPQAVVRNGSTVDVWLSSPTGDSSDSIIVSIGCGTDEQATQVMNAWLELILD